MAASKMVMRGPDRKWVLEATAYATDQGAKGERTVLGQEPVLDEKIRTLDSARSCDAGGEGGGGLSKCLLVSRHITWSNE